MTVSAYHLEATLLPNGTVPRDLWIVDGRITFEPQPQGCELAPAGGFATAGLTDAHTHLHFVADPDAPQGRAVVDANRREHLRAGTLLLRDMGATSDEVLKTPPDDGLPRVQTAGRCLLVESRHPFTVTAARDLAKTVAAQGAAGAQWVKIFADWPGWPGSQEEPNFGPQDALSYSSATLADAVREAHAAGARVAIHAFGREAAAAGIEAGVDSIEHGWGLDRSLLQAMADKAIGWTPLLGIAPDMLDGAVQSGWHEQAAWIRETQLRMQDLLPFAWRTGVPVLAGTDWFPHVTLTEEVLAMHQAGLAPQDALAAATSRARAFLGAPDLQEGAPADLVIYRDDPREDLRRLSRPEVVMLGGRIVTPAEA